MTQWRSSAQGAGWLRRRAADGWRRLPPVARLIAQRDLAEHELGLVREALPASSEGLPIDGAVRELVRRQAELDAGQMFPPGHYYSPIPDARWLADNATQVADANPLGLVGIDVRVDAQLALLEELRPLVADMPFGAEPTDQWRYGYGNDQYCEGDASCLFGMLRRLRPRRYVEVGSGWSSALALDVNAAYLGRSMSLTFIEPNPERLDARLRPEDRSSVTLHRSNVQDVDLDVFTSLEDGDVCFIDSSHVSKVASDVNFLVFEVLPRLAQGVRVHVHDIGWPFEYFEDWLRQGRNWNEAYLLRAYLCENPHYEIELWNHYLMRNHTEALCAALPLSARNGGASVWLKRV